MQSVRHVQLVRNLCVLVAAVGFLALAAWCARAENNVPAAGVQSEGAQPNGDWTQYGGNLAGQRYSPLSEITPANVGKLEVAWTYQTGDDPEHTYGMFEVTPLEVGSRLFLCTPSDQVIALDAATGKELWRFGEKHTNGLHTCRGVGYYNAGAGAADCPERIFRNLHDNHLWAIDAATGKPCASFGNGGSVDLVDGMGPHANFGYTAAPTVAKDLVIFGGTTGGSGVVRAFSALTGQLVWAWDAGRPGEYQPPYTRGTPNSWVSAVADTDLGLVYILTGVQGGSLSGQAMPKLTEQYGDSVVALDLGNGAVRWSFQTVHHDVWDYDSGAQPNLVDLHTAEGTVPVLVQPTKNGMLFVLDRRTGAPYARVVETPVPQNPDKGEWVPPTQPFSVDMPFLGTDHLLTEKDMWGATPIDQLWCRIKFRQLRYEGLFTPPMVRGTLFDPGDIGAVSWGGGAVDPKTGLWIVNINWAPWRVWLIPREQFTKDHPPGQPNYLMPDPGHFLIPQEDTPYAGETWVFLSPLGIPCNAPPWGRMVAIDLVTKKIVWSRRFGTTEERAPLHLPLPLGVFSHGGPIVTGGGLVFIGAAMDDDFRAYGETTGQELWKVKLPAGGQTTPMTYSVGGHQFVAIVAGGNAAMQTKRGDYVIAYKLPET